MTQREWKTAVDRAEAAIARECEPAKGTSQPEFTMTLQLLERHTVRMNEQELELTIGAIRANWRLARR